MSIARADRNVQTQCELVLRSLPRWFGQEDSLLEYVRKTSELPTFISSSGSEISGFVTLRQHFAQAFEVTCLAVHASSRGTGVGRALIEQACRWARTQGGTLLQVKTLAPEHPSPEYAQTRAFYAAMGFVPLEVFPTLWSARHPCLQLVKVLENQA
jgi:GNAT superfamily N-acetyltransferase